MTRISRLANLVKKKTKEWVSIPFSVALLAWLLFLMSDFILIFSHSQNLPTGIPVWAPRIFFAIYIVGIYWWIRTRFSADDDIEFTEILWCIFFAGLMSTSLSLLIRLVVYFMGEMHARFSLVVNSFILQLNLTLLLYFLLTALAAWRRLIFHQITKWLFNCWKSFTILLQLLLLYVILTPLPPQMAGLILTVVSAVMGIILLSRVRWIAYLNFRQKWRCLLLLFLSLAYLTYFSITIYYSFNGPEKIQLVTTLPPLNPFVNILAFFVAVYGIFSFLVILFNLPTTSVMEQKMEEILSFERLSESIQSEESIYNVLLEICLHTTAADAAWIEIQNKDREQIHTLRITEAESQVIGSLVKKHPPDEKHHEPKFKGGRYRSLLQVPVLVNGEFSGKLTVLKKLPNGFNGDMIFSVENFARQAGRSIEKFRLFKEAIQNARYKEELKIAKEVQKSLLPQKPETDPHFEMQAFSQAADEVGGDYYDTLRLSDHQIAWIIADVSGKGTSAAFHMSQMKGIFHTLGHLKFDPQQFMTTANMALKNCLEKNAFISAAYFIIDTQKKQISYARAGHCPILYYNATTQSTAYFKDRGAALGMMRSERYKDSIPMYEIDFNPGDVMVLFTDGITEARNGREEFGYDRLAAALRQVTAKTANEIQDHILRKVYDFTGSAILNDDYTMVIIKFLNQPNIN